MTFETMNKTILSFTCQVRNHDEKNSNLERLSVLYENSDDK